jgi:hypothetical protein
MQNKILAAAFLSLAAAAAPALAQQAQGGGIPTETQRRLAQGQSEFPWDAIGLFGLLGLLGLRRRHPDDSYHPAPIE